MVWLRICLCPKTLNRGIIHEDYKAAALEEITYQVLGAKIFSKLYATKSSWSVHLDHKSSLLTTVNTHLGQFCFQHMPFGLKMSWDMFQMKMDMILEKWPETFDIHDDVAVYGMDKEDPKANLLNLMAMETKNGLVFNSFKCEIKKPATHSISANLPTQASSQIQLKM